MKKCFLCVLTVLCVVMCTSCSLVTFPGNADKAPAAETSAPPEQHDLPAGLRRVDYTTEAKKAQAQAFLDEISVRDFSKTDFTLAVYDGFRFTPSSPANRYEEMLAERNRMVSDRLGVKLNELDSPLELMLDDSFNSYLSGSVYADAMIIPACKLGEFASKGHLLNRFSLPGISYEEEYFDTSNMEQMTGGTRAYAIAGAFTRDIGSYYCLYVNTKLLGETGLPSPCDLVKSGEWTWDRMLEYANAFSQISQGRYTAAAETVREMTDCVFKSTGLDYMNTGFNLKPSVGFDDERTDRAAYCLRSLFWSGSYFPQQSPDAAAAADMFAQGSVLFAFDTVGNMEKYSRLGRDWTILPVPKLDLAGDYISYLSPDTPVMVVPANSPDPEDTAVVIRALFAASYSFPDDGYYEYLTASAANGSETLAMLDYICGIRAGTGRIDFTDLYCSQYPELLTETSDTVKELAENPGLSRSGAADAAGFSLNWRMANAFPLS